MGRINRHRIEICLALAITLIAFLFVAIAVWAEQRPGIVVSEAWARPTIGKGRVTAAYATIENLGAEDDTLRGASSPKAERIEIHETTMNDEGVMKMRPLDGGLAIPAGGAVSLKPGGLHIMVMGLDGALAKGETLPLTLDFEKAGTVEISAPAGTGPSDEDAGGADHSHH